MSWNANNIGDQSGKTIVVTGANSGIGLEAVKMLADNGAEVVMACRSLDKAEEARSQVASDNVRVSQLDLADLSSVREFTDRFVSEHDRLDVLINNAGVMALPYRKTADGFEMQFGTNHLGHFALTARLFETLRATPNARVVTVSSIAHRMGTIRFDDLMGERSYRRWPAYGQSKLANLLFMKELARRLDAANLPIRSIACHPGYASTNLQTAGARMQGQAFRERFMEWANGLFAQSAHRGALPTVYAAVADDAQSGDFIGPDGLLAMTGAPNSQTPNRAARDAETARRLWDVSEELTGERFAVPTPD